MSTKICKPVLTVQALCALIRLVTYRLVTPRYSALADGGPSLWLAGMIPKEVIVSTKRCEPSPVQALCALMRLVNYRVVTSRYRTLAILARYLGWGDDTKLCLHIPKDVSRFLVFKQCAF